MTALAALACIAFFMLFWVLTSIIIPLEKLREATRKIKEGDLDFSLEAEAEDEIGELFLDFEEMRIRLKENQDSDYRHQRLCRGNYGSCGFFSRKIRQVY